MKLNKYFMLGLAGLAFAACSNDDEVDNALTQGTKQVSVTIKTASTRSVVDEFTADTDIAKAIKNDDIDIYFLNAQGIIVDKQSMGNQDTKTFHNISNTVTQIAAVGNYHPAVTLGTTDFASVEASNVAIADYQESASNVPIYAAPATLQPAGTDNHADDATTYNLYKAELTLSTQMARIEIGGDLVCTNLGTAYSQLALSYVGLNAVNLQYVLATGTSSNQYNAADNAAGFPVLTGDAATPTYLYASVFTPAATDADAPTYETTLVAPTAAPGEATDALENVHVYNIAPAMPNLIFRFEPEIKPNDKLLPNDPAYLKVVGFKTTENGTTADVTITAGNIYQIEDFIFAEENLTPLVKDAICVQALVKVTPWEIKTVYPVYGE